MSAPTSTKLASSDSSPRISGPLLTPVSTPGATPRRSASATRRSESHHDLTEMDGVENENPVDHEVPPTQQSPSANVKSDSATADDAKATTSTKPKSGASAKCSRHRKAGKRSKKSKKRDTREQDTSDSSSDSSDEESEDEDDHDSSADSSDSSESVSSDDEILKAKAKAKKKRAAQRKKDKLKGKSNKGRCGSKRVVVESDSESDESESELSSEDESSVDEKRRRRKHKKKGGRSRRRRDEEEEDEMDDEAPTNPLDKQRQAMLRALGARRGLNFGAGGIRKGITPKWVNGIDLEGLGNTLKSKGKGRKKAKGRAKAGKRASTLEYKRVDQLWDSTIHNYKLTESAEDQEDEFDHYVFTVRRKFDWENKYKNTVVDIKSKLLREALQEVMKDVKGVSLVEDQPSVDPNMLFLHLQELRTHAKKTLKARAKAEKKSKNRKKIKLAAAHCKVLLGYLDEDYEETKKTLYPMLEAGNITFDLLWALFKPNTIAYTTTYGSADHPRAFKVDYANKEQSFMRGEWYSVEGRYLEYDGKSFGLGDFEVQVDSFKGPRKITSLSTYPIQYHKDPEGLKKQLVERGKTFIALSGMNYRFHKGLAFMKKKKIVAKVNINGRIMIDPSIFRRINPNYPISMIKPKDADEGIPCGDSEEDNTSDCGCDESEEEVGGAGTEGRYSPEAEKEPGEKTKFKVVWDKEQEPHVVEVPVDEDGKEVQVENIDKLPEDRDPKQQHTFSEEELLIASPVVLGFAFSEKLWLEFTLEGVREIEWNDGAFESLVLPANQKSIVKALVESHKFHASKTIDDVVQGKGKGLCAVLHGPPGTGKTLTAEGIAELLRCPLYGVTASELGTEPRLLEHELQKILDIAHSWGAVLLLDEADVFLEKREVHDIHRNALVSIFLRLLEYFQGILFLTTNRVETFDDAFQSRIHVALRYGELTTKAKKAVWKMFLERVRIMESAQEANNPTKTASSPAQKPSTLVKDEETGENKVRVANFSEVDFDRLARNNLNGRQIKNAVRTAQALALNEDAVLGMEHIRRVLEVAESFEKDLKGGSGYDDAMRSYT